MPSTPSSASSTPSAARQLGLLLRVRWRILVNATSGWRLAAWSLGLLGIVGVTVGAGVLTADALATASVAPLDPGETVAAGGAYAETAFWLTALAIFGFSFRIMEAIYRRQDVRLLATYPIALEAQFWYRFVSAGGEVLAAFGLLGLYLATVWWTGGDVRALYGIGEVGAGLLTCLTLGFAVQLGAGRAVLRGGNETIDRLGQVDAGGFAAAFYYAPAVAMISSLVLLLVVDLGVVGEHLTRGGSRLFQVSAGLVAAACVGSVFVARRMFVRHYPHLLARFYESDLVQLSSGYDYQKSVQQQTRGLWEVGLSDRALPVFRKNTLQYGRRYPMVRLLTFAIWGALGLAAWRDAAPTWALAAAPLVLLALVIVPWARMASHDIQAGVGRTLPIRAADEASGQSRAVLREVVLLAAPSAVIVAALEPLPTSIGAAVAGLVGAVVLAVVCANIAGRGHVAASWWLGSVVSVLTVAGGYLAFGYAA